MRIRLAVPDAAVRPDVLDAALEAVTRTDEALLDAGHIPTAERAIAAGVRWRPEPPGDEHFDPASTVLKRGHGDCDDLAPWHAASLRHTGEDPDARAVVRKSGRNKWHAIVQRSDGSLDDPSAEAGMYEYRAPLQPRMAGPRHKPSIATKRVVVRSRTGPARAIWCARCDVPWRGSSHAISGHGMGNSSRAAASDAIQGAIIVGDMSGAIEPEHAARLAALEALMHGADPAEVEAALRHMGMSGAHVGSFFGKLIKTAAHLVPIPGVATAYDAAASLIPSGGHKGAAPAAAAHPMAPSVPHAAPFGPPFGPPIGPSNGHQGSRRGSAPGHFVQPGGPIIVRF